MTTQYTTILKLALPVQGELSGTWGTVVNENITEMIEEAIAGLKTINSWTTNSHVLTTADGTTSEARAAILELEDDGSGNPTAAASVICPALSKIYLVKNACGQTATIKTSGGTGVAIPDGQTAIVYCDGTNVVAGSTFFNNVDIDGGTIDGVTLGTNSAVTEAQIDNINIDGNAITSTDTNGNIDLTPNGTGEVNITKVDIDDGTIDGTVIGGTTPAAGTFTTLTTSSTISGTTMQLTSISATNFQANDDTAAFTIADTTGIVTVSTELNVDNINIAGNTIVSTDTDGNIALTPNGAGEVDISKVDIDSGTIDGTSIGASTAAAGTFTDLTANTSADFTGATVTIDTGTIDGVTLGTNSAVTEAQIDNININGNTITSTDTDGNIALTPDGTGEVDISKVDIDSGTIDGTVIGAGTPAAGSFTTGQFDTSVNVDGTVTSDGLTVDGTSGAVIRGSNDAEGEALVIANSSGGTALRAWTQENVGVKFLSSDSSSVARDYIFYTGTSSNEVMRIDSSGTLIHKAAAVFNEDGGDNDFRVESDSNDHMLFVDAGNNYVGIGTSGLGTGATFEVNGTMTVEDTSDDNTSLRIKGGTQNLYIQSGSSYGGVLLNSNQFVSQEYRVNQADIMFSIDNGTTKNLHIDYSGVSQISINGINFTHNPSGGDYDFRVESVNNDHMLFVDAGNDRVGIGTNSPSEALQVNGAAIQVGSGTTGQINVWSSDYNIQGGSNYGDLRFNAPRFRFYEDSTLSAQISGTTFTAHKAATINEDGGDNDFRVESDTNTHALFVDAFSRMVGIEQSAPAYLLDVGNGTSSISGGYTMRINSNGDTIFSHSRANTSLMSFRNDSTGYVCIASNNSANLMLGYSASDVGAIANHLYFTSGATIVNEGGADRDFRVESDSNDHALYVDAGNNVTGTNVPFQLGAIGNGTNAQIFNSKTPTANTATDIFSVGLVSGAFACYIDVIQVASSGYAGRTAQYLWWARRAVAGNGRNVIELSNNSLGSVNTGVIPVPTFTATAVTTGANTEKFQFESTRSDPIYFVLRVVGSYATLITPV